MEKTIQTILNYSKIVYFIIAVDIFFLFISKFNFFLTGLIIISAIGSFLFIGKNNNLLKNETFQYDEFSGSIKYKTYLIMFVFYLIFKYLTLVINIELISKINNVYIQIVIFILPLVLFYFPFQYLILSIEIYKNKANQFKNN